MVSKSPLQIQAYDYLKEMILSGRLDPDVLYSETRMSAEIGISRTPMREAIQCLSQDGYITVVPFADQYKEGTETAGDPGAAAG